MAFKKKIWSDRVAEFINRRILTKEDGTTELVTVARSEGTVSTEGDGFNAKTMNDLEQRIADEFSSQNETFAKKISELNDSLTGVSAAITAENNQQFNFAYQNGKYGYLAEVEGADTFFPFSDACNKVAFYGVNGIWQESTYMALQLVDNNLAEQTNYITITIKKNGSYRLITGSYFYMRLYINSVFHSVATCNNTLLNLKQGDKITVFNANDYTSHGAVVLFYVGE